MVDARFYRPALVAAALALGACATAPPAPVDASLASRCTRAFAALDAEVDAAGVRDGQAARIDGFPALRATRFLASFAAEPMDDAAFRAWRARLAGEGRDGRLVEIANLPPAATQRALAALAAEGFAALPPPAFVEGCSHALAVRDDADPARREALRAQARVPDDYDDVARAVGLYPLARLAAAAALRAYEAGVHAAYGDPGPGTRVAYAPEGAQPLAAAEVQALLARGRADPLGMPALDDADVDRLLATYAPVVAIAARSDDDRPGRPAFGADGRPAFVPMPVVFGRLAHTRYAGATRVQLVYATWFAARTPAFPGDPLAGTYDAVLWRVTLDDDGAPLAFDAVHACGCYALYVSTPRVAERPRAATLDEQPLVVAQVPVPRHGQRVAVTLAGGTHAIRDVRVVDAPPGGALRYRLGRDDALRSIALPGGGTRSLYRPDGIVAGSERAERFVFWPLGIRDAGAMRQWGRHATAFVGRRHFDEAHLLDRAFVPAREPSTAPRPPAASAYNAALPPHDVQEPPWPTPAT